MSEYYGYLTGNRGTTTRCGSKSNGIRARIRSWHVDVRAWLYDRKGEDFLDLEIPQGLLFAINGEFYKIGKNGKTRRTKE